MLQIQKTTKILSLLALGITLAALSACKKEDNASTATQGNLTVNNYVLTATGQTKLYNADGVDFHGAGAVRFDTKEEGGPLGEGGERYYNFVRLVRDVQ